MLLRLMDKLVADGKLAMKAFGKAQVYWASQDGYTDVSAALRVRRRAG